MRALVVDDSAAMRAVLHRALAKIECEVVEAANGMDALASLDHSNFEVVLMDWNMPVMNGFELLKRIREESRFDPVKLVMVTTETNLDEMSHALAAGANEYIMKPFTPAVVYDKLRLLGLWSPVGAAVAGS